MENISFLLGAGFSRPAGYPLVKEINKKFSNLSLDDFFIYSDESAYFGTPPQKRKIANITLSNESPNNRSRRQFVVDFINFYCSEILPGKESFNYEAFFDYYMQLMQHAPDLNENDFFSSFRKKHNYDWDNYNLLFQFNRTFQQLLANYLQHEWPKAEHFSGPYPESLPHKNFLELLDLLKDNHKVHIHTLNHDLLMEKYFHYDPLAGNIDDGFDDFGSPYYGITDNNGIAQRIRLKRFVNKYDARFNLYKLHGSIDFYRFATNREDQDMIKKEYGLLPRGIEKEVTTHLEKSYKNGGDDTVPEFLSGTTEKIKHYENKLYYSQVFERFKNNLKNSEFLIVIGYGFGDSKINSFLEEYFLNKKKTMIVIDPYRPEYCSTEKDNVKYLETDKTKISIDLTNIKKILQIN